MTTSMFRPVGEPSDRPLYRVTVRPFEPVAAQWDDEKTDPIADGLVALTETQRKRLAFQLLALMGEDFIGDFDIELVSTLPDLTPEEIVARVAEGFDDEARGKVLSLWEETTSAG